MRLLIFRTILQGKQGFPIVPPVVVSILQNQNRVLMDIRDLEEQASFLYLLQSKQGQASMTCPFQRPVTKRTNNGISGKDKQK